MAVTLEQFAARLVAAGLLEQDELTSFSSSLPAALQDAQSLARELIQAGLLTKYQAAAVYTGETQGLVLGNYVILDKLGEGGMGTRTLHALPCLLFGLCFGLHAQSLSLFEGVQSEEKPLWIR